MAEAGSAFVSIVPSAKGFGKSLEGQVGPDLTSSGKSIGKSFGGTFASAAKSLIGPAIALVSISAATGFLKDSIAEARESQKVGALTANVIKTTGGAAKITAAEVGKLATAISNKTGVDDEAVQSGSNLILTFKNIKREGTGLDDVFGRATAAAVDLSASGFGDINGASKMLGKALNDPLKGITALGRAGVTFTAGQQEMIKGFVKTGDLLSAQKIILKEVESQVGGSAAASATAGEKLSTAFKNFEETIGTALLPVIDKLEAKLVSDVIPALSNFVTGMQDGTGAGGQVARTIGDIYSAALPVAGAIKSIAGAFGDLPSSTQKIILLAGAVLLLKNRFGDSLPSMSSFSSSATAAAAKTAAIRTGAGAAAVGLAALASSAGGANTSLGGLATIGAGVAAGFAVGGPWGAAIGGAAGALSVFSHRNDDAKAAQDRLNTSLSGVSGTLNQQTGALTAATRATVAKALADNGAFDSANKVGVSLRDVTSAALGNEAATKRVQDAIKSWVAQQEASGKPTRDTIETVATLTNAIGTSTTELEASRKKLGQEKEALESLPKLTKVTVNMDTSSFSASLRYVIASMNKIGSLSATAKADLHASDVGANAKGTNNWRGGLTMVGENGPELINLAKGAQVIPNNRISALMGAHGSDSSGSAMASLDGATITIVDGGHMANSFQGIVTSRSDRMVSR